jgi:hypothetical protein
VLDALDDQLGASKTLACGPVMTATLLVAGGCSEQADFGWLSALA